MLIQNIKQQLIENGYQGFYEIKRLFQNDSVIPKEKGSSLLQFINRITYNPLPINIVLFETGFSIIERRKRCEDF